MMTEERFRTLRDGIRTVVDILEHFPESKHSNPWILLTHECLTEIERLRGELEKATLGLGYAKQKVRHCEAHLAEVAALPLDCDAEEV